MRPNRLLFTLIAALALPIAASAAPQAKDANGANPSDITTPKTGDGAIIDKTRGAAASAAAPNDMNVMQGAKGAAMAGSGTSGGRKQRPAPIAKGASSSM